jgi:hypothetical protein
MRIKTSPRITQKGDKDNLDLTSKHPFAFKRGINAARREKGALFPKCAALFPLFKNLPAIVTYLAACTTFECWKRRVTKGKTKVVEAMEGEGVRAPSPKLANSCDYKNSHPLQGEDPPACLLP